MVGAFFWWMLSTSFKSDQQRLLFPPFWNPETHHVVELCHALASTLPFEPLFLIKQFESSPCWSRLGSAHLFQGARLPLPAAFSFPGVSPVCALSGDNYGAVSVIMIPAFYSLVAELKCSTPIWGNYSADL